MGDTRRQVWFCWIAAAALTATASVGWSQGFGGGRGAARPSFIPANYDDHQNMMDQLGVKTLRPGRNGNQQTGKGFEDALANDWMGTMPDVLKMNDGTKVTTKTRWPQRRAEIAEDFEREVYGRVPAVTPRITWEVSAPVAGMRGGIATVTRTLTGHVDNSGFPQITVNLRASFTVPADAPGPVPILLEFGGVPGAGGPGGGGPGAGGGRGGGAAVASWQQQAIEHGWGYGFFDPNSVQADAGGNALRQGIIGLCNKGEPRKPEDWGALRAWQWGISQLIDYFEAHPEARVDAKKVGVEGVSRYGKAAIVAEAFEPRVGVAFIASSGEGGVKLYRHDMGESVENLTGGEYYWMGGNFIKYGASDVKGKSLNASDLPVDTHELVAMCAPRPCFISYGIPTPRIGGGIGDPAWVDAHGGYMAGVLATPVYELFGEKGYGNPSLFSTDVAKFCAEPMPPVSTLVGGQLAWRQHEGGHTSVPNFPAFFEWVGQYITSPVNRAAGGGVRAAPEGRRAPPGGADVASPRMDNNSRLAHAQLLEKAKLGKGKIDVYFEGDSIIRRWGATDYPKYLANWKENFFGWNAADFGWGADRVENILWRLENGELDGVEPKVIVLLGGTNNLDAARGEANAADISKGLQAVVDICRQKAPGAVIIVTGIFPRNDNMADLPIIHQVNENLAKMADGKSIRYLNINGKLADQEGKLLKGMMNGDRLHPDTAGYQVWADALKPIFTEILGPPGKEDHAPPATGDPSAARP